MRVVVVTLRPMLRDIVTTMLQNRAPVTIVGEFSERAPIGQLESLGPNLIILGLRTGEDDGIGQQYLAEIPAATVLMISSDGREAFVHRAPDLRIVLHSVSLDALGDALAVSELGN